MKRDGALLEEEVTTDRLFNFVVTAYSLVDWVKNDPKVPLDAKDPKVLGSLRDDQWIKVCGDLAIACKHFELTKRRPITAKTQSRQGGRYGIGEEWITVQLNDGFSFNCLFMADNVIDTWEDFFQKFNIR